MEFGTREILIILGVLVFLAIVLDGIRRMGRARSGKLRSSRRKQPIFDDEKEDFGSELPSGPARVVEVRDEHIVELVSQKIKQDCDYNRNKLTSAFQKKIEEEQIVADDFEVNSEAAIQATDTEIPGTGSVDNQQKDIPDAEPRKEKQASAPSVNEEVLILHLMARNDRVFQGAELLEHVLALGLRYGDMKIFHRHENQNGSGPVHFSLANSVNPGTFDLGAMDEFTTPGITFIMPLGGLKRPLKSFDELIQTAATLAKQLDGELKDETRSALTRQTIEHYKQRIIEFTRHSFTLTN